MGDALLFLFDDRERVLSPLAQHEYREAACTHTHEMLSIRTLLLSQGSVVIHMHQQICTEARLITLAEEPYCEGKIRFGFCFFMVISHRQTARTINVYWRPPK